MTLKGVLLSIQSLLAEPVPTDPQDAVVANEYLNNYQKWKLTAKAWTHEYATPKVKLEADVDLSTDGSISKNTSQVLVDVDVVDDEKLSMLLSMGFSKENSTSALLLKNGNIEAAVEYLFSQA